LSVILTYVVQTPYIALGVELTMDFDGRSSLFGYAQAFYMSGIALATGLPDFIIEWFPNTKLVFIFISVGCGVTGSILFMVMCSKLKEQPNFVKNKSNPMIPGIRAVLLENKPFVILLVVITLQNSAPYTLALLPFWVQYTLELDSAQSSLIMLVFILSGFVFIPLWNRISVLWGKRKAYLLALISSFIGLSLMVVPQKHQFILALITTMIAGMGGIGLTTYNFLYQSIQGDVIDYDELRTGLRREAQYANIMQFFNWYMSVLSTTMPFIILATLGFSSDARQTEKVRRGLGILVASAGLFSLAAAITLLFYPISKKKYHKILEGINKHKQGFPAKDPLTKEIIAAHSLKSEDDNNTYWLLYTFSYLELKATLTSFKGIKFLYSILALEMTLWALIMLAAGALWVFYPFWYIFWGYTVILSFCFILYHSMRLKSISQLVRQSVTRDQIQKFLLK